MLEVQRKVFDEQQRVDSYEIHLNQRDHDQYNEDLGQCVRPKKFLVQTVWVDTDYKGWATSEKVPWNEMEIGAQLNFFQSSRSKKWIFLPFKQKPKVNLSQNYYGRDPKIRKSTMLQIFLSISYIQPDTKQYACKLSSTCDMINPSLKLQDVKRALQICSTPAFALMPVFHFFFNTPTASMFT